MKTLPVSVVKSWSLEYNLIIFLGSFQTHSVIAMLFELVSDNEPNVRAIAALALAKTGKCLFYNKELSSGTY